MTSETFNQVLWSPGSLHMFCILSGIWWPASVPQQQHSYRARKPTLIKYERVQLDLKCWKLVDLDCFCGRHICTLFFAFKGTFCDSCLWCSRCCKNVFLMYMFMLLGFFTRVSKCIDSITGLGWRLVINYLVQILTSPTKQCLRNQGILK